MTPALAIQAIPLTDRAELRVSRGGAARPLTSIADRGTGASPRHPHIACLPISVQDRADAGELRLFTAAEGGFDGAAVVVAEILASTVEAAFDRALAGDGAARLQNRLMMDYDIGVATGLVMATRGVERKAAYQVLCDISRDSNRRVADVAAELIQVGESGPRPPRLRLVVAPDERDQESTP